MSDTELVPCARCGACCRMATPSLLAAHGLPEAEGGGCAHLSEHGLCSIYESRPKACSVNAHMAASGMSREEYTRHSLKACKALRGMEALRGGKE